MQRNKYQSVYTRGFTHSKSSLNNSQAVENSSRITCVNRVVLFVHGFVCQVIAKFNYNSMVPELFLNM